MLIVALIIYITLLTVVTVFQRRMIYYPSHHSETNGLAPWIVDGRTIGYVRKANNPKNVWLFTNGNGGQAADRAYALQCFSDSDSVFILEYPGYGNREGSPGKLSFDSAAEVAYRELRRSYLNTPVCVVGESIGSGPASTWPNYKDRRTRSYWSFLSIHLRAWREIISLWSRPVSSFLIVGIILMRLRDIPEN
jgi:hypothetical protein